MHRALTFLCSVVFWLISSSAHAGSFSNLYVFGDSLSDTGNLYAFFGGVYPPSPPYYDGRFSNGPVWSEQFASELGLGALTPDLLGGSNFAVAGATTTGNLNSSVLPPATGAALDAFSSLDGQLGRWSAQSGGVADPNALYVVAFGSNDLQGALQAASLAADPLATISSIMSAAATAVLAGVNQLISAGAEHILVLNTPDLTLTPRYNSASAGVQFLIEYGATLFNTTLAGGLSLLSGTDIDLLDINALLASIVADPAAYGYSNATSACLDSTAGTLCSNPDQYVYWDDFHPSTLTHARLAAAALVAVDEPATLALLPLSLLALLPRRRRC